MNTSLTDRAGSAFTNANFVGLLLALAVVFFLAAPAVRADASLPRLAAYRGVEFAEKGSCEIWVNDIKGAKGVKIEGWKLKRVKSHAPLKSDGTPYWNSCNKDLWYRVIDRWNEGRKVSVTAWNRQGSWTRKLRVGICASSFPGECYR